MDPAVGTRGPADLHVLDGRISHPPADSEPEKNLSAEGLYVAPGFLDLQVNGGGGQAFAEADAPSLQAIADSHVAGGTTGFLATAITSPLSAMRRALETVRRADHPAVLGMHLEGPFISPKRAGAHNPRHILTPSREELVRLLEGCEELVRLVTLAPELEGAGDLIENLLAAGAVPALGHSDATYEQAMESVRRGVRSFTHLFNAMRGFHHREPGAVGAALDADAFVELICDGVHVHPAAVRLVARARGFDSICLVTDAMAAAGLSDGEYSLGGLPVTVRDGVARLADGTLAGSTLTMNQAVKNFMDYTGCSLPEAVRCASLNPARLLGLEQRKGSLEGGKDADLVIFNDELTVHYTIVGGEIAFSQEESGVLGDRF